MAAASIKELEAFFQRYLSAYLEKRDFELLEPLLGDSLQGIGSGLHEIALNRATSDELFRRDLSEITEPIDYQILQLDIRRPLPDVGLIFAVLRLNIRAQDQQMLIDPLRFSLVVLRQSGNWKLQQLHVSIPSEVHDEDESFPVKELQARQAALEQLVAEKTAQLELALAEAHQLARTDQLTGLKNRFSIETLTLEKLALARQQQYPLCLILLDIDLFKAINDHHGHQTGDLVLRCFAEQLQAWSSEQTAVGRWGGEEFLILCDGLDIKATQNYVEQLRARLSQADFSPLDQVTASFGIAQMQPEDTLDSLLLRADACLYQAKAKGRNCVVTSPD